MPYLGKQPNKSATSKIGTGLAEDTMLTFDGNALDFRIGIDDGTDSLEIGKGDAHGTTAHMIFDTNGIISKPLQPAFNVSPNPSSTQENIAFNS